MRTLNEQIQRLRDILVTCYNAIAAKGGTIPEAGERNMTNLPAAVDSIPQELKDVNLEELTITADGVYIPSKGVNGFSKVTAEFDTSTLPKVRLSTFKVSNDCIENGRWNGENLIDTSIMNSLQDIFYSVTNLTTLDITGWCTSKITNLYRMFQNCTNLKNLNLNDWDTSNVINFSDLFNGCSSIENLDLTHFDTHSVTSMMNLFNGCASLKSLNISNWDVSNVTNMTRLMTYVGLETLDIKHWNVSNVKSFHESFRGARIKVLDLRTWNVSNVTDTTFMFYLCDQLYSLVGEDVSVNMNNIVCLNGLKISLSLNTTILDRASLRAVINGLADLTGQTTQTLTLGTTLIAKLTEEDIAVATNKNWTIA